MNATRFVYSTDFVRLDRKLLISYDSADPHSSFVRVLSIDGEELIKEKCADNLDDLWAIYDEMYENLRLDDEYRVMAEFLLSL